METNEKTKEIGEGFVCFLCGENCIENSELFFQGESDQIICQKCSSDYCFECFLCNNIERLKDRFCVNGDRHCQNCFEDNYFSCDSCGGLGRADDVHTCCGNEQRCGECCYECNPTEDDEISDYLLREYSKEKTHCSRGKRMFAFEVECNYDSQSNVRDIYNNQKLLDIGIETDGSLGSKGIELITPVLSGKKGLNYLKYFTDELSKNDFSVDSRCGLHIHLDGKDFVGNDNAKLAKLKKLALFYLYFEDVIMSFIPESRRKNTYCLPISESFTSRQVINCYTLEDFETLWYKDTDKANKERRKSNKYDDTRYAGINFHSLLSNKHLEIRYHTGSISYVKMMNWAKLHIMIMNSITLLQDFHIKNAKYLTSLTAKTDLMFKLIKLDDESIIYFKDRQKKFYNGSEEDEKNVCVE